MREALDIRASFYILSIPKFILVGIVFWKYNRISCVLQYFLK